MKERRGGIEALSVLLFGLLPIGVLFAAYVILYVQSRNEYLTQRNYRALSTMGRNLASRLEGINEAVKNNRQEDSSWDPQWVKAIPNLDPGPCKGSSDSSLAWRLADGRGSSRLTLGCRTVLVEKFLRPSIAPALFDDLLVVRAGTSDVVYHRYAFELGDMPDLATLLVAEGQPDSDKKSESRSDGERGQSGRQEKRGEQGKGEKKHDVVSAAEPKTDTSFAFQKARDLDYFGERYLAYAVPLTLDFKFGGEPAPAGEEVKEADGSGEHLVLFGLVRKARFMAEARELSLSLLLGLALLLLLALFNWPLLKLWFLGARERLDALNVYILGVAMIASLGLFTVGILDLVFYRGLVAGFDADLGRLSEEMKTRLKEQVETASRTLGEAAHSLAGNGRPSAAPLPSTTAAPDDNIDQVFLMNGSGDPISAWKPLGSVAPPSSAPAPLPWLVSTQPSKRLNVADRDYFKAVQEGRFWALGVGRFAGDVVQSRVDGRTSLVLATPLSGGRQLVVSVRPPSVIGAKLPPGYSFAVVDRYGKVMLHADDRRILQENLFQETDDGGRLRSAIVTRLEQNFDSNYYGQPHRFVTSPWNGTPWSLVVMYQKDPMRRVNTAVVATWSVMFTLYLAGFVVAALLCQFFWPGYRAEWIWPRRELTRSYLVGAFLCLTTLVSCFVVFEPTDAASQVARTAGGPALAALALYVVLAPRKRAFWIAALVCLWLGAGSLFAHVRHGASALAPLLVPLATVVLLPFCKPATPRNEASFRFAYTLMLFAFLAVAAPAPSAVLFDDSLDEATLSFMRWNERESLRALTSCKQSSPQGCRPPQYAGFYSDLFRHAAVKIESSTSDSPLEKWVARWLDTRKVQAHLALHFFPRIPVRSDAIPGYNQMVVNKAADGSWEWTPTGERGGEMKFDEAGDASPEAETFRARAPSFFAAAGWELWAMVVIAIVVLMVATFLVLGSIVRRLFLLDADADGGVHLPVRPTGLRGIYLMWRPLRTIVSPDEAWLATNDLVLDLERQSTSECASAVEKLDPHANHIVIVDHFESRLDDAKATRAKIDLLGKLERRDEIAVVLVSDLEPLWFSRSVAEGAENGTSQAASDASRWAEALRSYYTSCVLPPEPATTVAGGGPLGLALAGVLARRTREQTEEGRSEGRHSRLWGRLSRSEKLALIQLADEGFLNPKIPEVARSLMERGLIRRDPAFLITDRGFPEFVSGAEASATVQAWERQGARSSWAKLRPALILLLIFGVGFLYSTQRGLFSETVALATAVTGAVPLLLRLFAGLGRQPDGGSSGR
jgi:hypothetical protein